jgi:hypothetical protein
LIKVRTGTYRMVGNEERKLHYNQSIITPPYCLDHPLFAMKHLEMTNRPPPAGLMAGWTAGPAPGWGGAQRFPMGFPAGPPPPLGFGFPPVGHFPPPPIRFLPTPLQRLPHHPQPFVSRPHQSNSPKSANVDAAVSDSEPVPTKTDAGGAAEAVSASSKLNPSSSSRSSPNKAGGGALVALPRPVPANAVGSAKAAPPNGLAQACVPLSSNIQHKL